MYHNLWLIQFYLRLGEGEASIHCFAIPDGFITRHRIAFGPALDVVVDADIRNDGNGRAADEKQYSFSLRECATQLPVWRSVRVTVLHLEEDDTEWENRKVTFDSTKKSRCSR